MLLDTDATLRRNKIENKYTHSKLHITTTNFFVMDITDNFQMPTYARSGTSFLYFKHICLSPFFAIQNIGFSSENLYILIE